MKEMRLNKRDLTDTPYWHEIIFIIKKEIIKLRIGWYILSPTDFPILKVSSDEFIHLSRVFVFFDQLNERDFP